MAEMLLDATVFRDYRSGDPGARAIIEKIMSGEVSASVSPLTLFELWSGAGFDRKCEIGYIGMLSFLDEAPLSSEAAKVAGIWIGALEEGEQEELSRFALIAATAKVRGEPICTRNTESFGRFYSELISY